MRVNRLKLKPDKPDMMLEGKSDVLLGKRALTIVGFDALIKATASLHQGLCELTVSFRKLWIFAWVFISVIFGI